MVDNSQGHSAYAKDALLAHRMNWRSSGKQASMRDGWFMMEGMRVVQKMTFPATHAKFPNKPKGARQILTERGLYRSKLKFNCDSTPSKCDPDAHDCCGRRILELQPDFREQKSLVQEVIAARGHLCIFLPKFHCELNFIEFFWGAVKRYLRENCDYTFQTLKDNMPKALKSVDISTIRKWEHRMVRWMAAYRSGLEAKAAQIEVKKFSSRRFASHRRVPETVARSFD